VAGGSGGGFLIVVSTSEKGAARTPKRTRNHFALHSALGQFLNGLCLFLALTIFAGGLAFAQARSNNTPDVQPPAPEKVEAPKTIPGTATPDQTGLPIDPKSYVIGPEDVIYIKVWRENDFTGPQGVRPDGKITIPLIGDLQAAGLTPERLAAQLTQALSQYINKPEITVTIAQVNSKKFTITGEVNRPGVYPLVVATKIFDALGSAGGFRDFANKKDIVIIRGDKRLKFNWNEVVKGKKLEQNILLENGDTILVK
jgi:polysaccharide export outer membrane protein